MQVYFTMRKQMRASSKRLVRDRKIIYEQVANGKNLRIRSVVREQLVHLGEGSAKPSK